MSEDNKQAITLQPANIGKLTSDVIRAREAKLPGGNLWLPASLHSRNSLGLLAPLLRSRANPSAVLRHIMSGILNYVDEALVKTAPERAMYDMMLRRLSDVRNEILAMEDKI